MFRYLPLYSVGMLSYEMQTRSWARTFLQGKEVALVAGLFLVSATLATRNPDGVALPAFVLFFLCVACGNSLLDVLNTRGALVLGECSFGIYALHGIVLESAFTSIASSHVETGRWMVMLSLPIMMIAAFLLSVASYLLIERPSIAGGKSLACRLDGRARVFGRSELEVAP